MKSIKTLLMQLSEDEVRRIAHLARLQMSDEEVARLAREMTNILDYVELLDELDTTGVPETSQVTGLSNQLREDEVDGTLCEPEALLDCSPLPKSDGQIAIKRIL